MDKSLKKLSRLELLNLLVEASETNEALVAENVELRKAASEAPQKPPLQAAKVGSIAEAALKANGYFEAAQRSADDYLREIKRLRDRVAERTAAQEQRLRLAGEQLPQATQEQMQAQMQQQVQAQVQAQIEPYRQHLQAQMQQQLQAQQERLQAQYRTQVEQLQAQARQQAQAQVPSVVQAPDVVQDAQRQAGLIVSQDRKSVV